MKGPLASVLSLLLTLSTVVLLSHTPTLEAQTAAQTTVPRLVHFSGTATDLNGQPLNGVVGITFLLYAEQTGGAPLWLENQNVQADAKGHYSVLLGSTKPEGLPAELFTSEQARWVGVQISGQSEQPRFLLVSAPYALKAGDAETLGGLPPSAFALANTVPAAATSVSASTAGSRTASNARPSNTPNPPITGAGTAKYIPLWDGASDIVNSALYQSNFLLGVNTTTPAATLDINGTASVRSTLTLFPTFGLKGPPPVMSVAGTAFGINSKGFVQFASGQTFPGTAELASPNAFTSSQSINLSAANTIGLNVSSTGSGSEGVLAYGGQDGGFFIGGDGGIVADTDNNTNFAYGVFGAEYGSTAETFGVFGYSASSAGIGTYGQGISASSVGTNLADQFPVGVWGDTGAPDGVGVMGTSDTSAGVYGISNATGDGEGGGAAVLGYANDGYAFSGLNQSNSYPTAYLTNMGGPAFGPTLFAGLNPNAACTIDGIGDLTCSGTITANVPAAGGTKRVAVNSIQSPESWFEDFGSAQLSGGEAVVNIESVFGETVNTGVDYHVFLTPNGDCKGLYVAQKSATSFVVRELGGGTSSLAFDYRIAAKRRGYEQVRLADRTKELASIKRPRHLKPVPSAARHTTPNGQQIRQQQMAHARLAGTNTALLPNRP